MNKYYAKFNALYFDNALPKDTLVGWNKEIKGYACTVIDADDETKHTFSRIYIDPRKHHENRQVLITLLHEMAHIHLYPYLHHGKKFDREIIRLAVRGAFKGLI